MIFVCGNKRTLRFYYTLRILYREILKFSTSVRLLRMQKAPITARCNGLLCLHSNESSNIWQFPFCMMWWMPRWSRYWTEGPAAFDLSNIRTNLSFTIKARSSKPRRFFGLSKCCSICNLGLSRKTRILEARNSHLRSNPSSVH